MRSRWPPPCHFSRARRLVSAEEKSGMYSETSPVPTAPRSLSEIPTTQLPYSTRAVAFTSTLPSHSLHPRTHSLHPRTTLLPSPPICIEFLTPRVIIVPCPFTTNHPRSICRQQCTRARPWIMIWQIISPQIILRGRCPLLVLPSCDVRPIGPLIT